MSKHKGKATVNLETISGYARDLMTATADVTGENVNQARKRLNDALELAREKYDDVRQQTLSTVRVADDFIGDNPYAAVGIGVVLGVAIGFLLRGRRD